MIKEEFMIGDKYKYYQTLEVSENASKEEIKNSFKRLAKKWHPDKNQGKETLCKDMFVKIYTSYQVLSDDSARLEYDRFLNALRSSDTIDRLLEQEQIFAEWLRKSKKDAQKKYKEFKNRGDDFIDILINFSVGIVKITGIGIQKIVKAGKKAIDKTFTPEQKLQIKKISKITAKGLGFFFKSLFNTILFSFVGLGTGWVIGRNFINENKGDLIMNIIWLGTTLIALIYNFIFRHQEELN